MPLRRWMLVPALAASLALPLAGCTPTTPKPTPTKSASRTPIFSSDEEALAAATKAYAAYLKMSDTISHDGGANPERIKKYATGDALKLALKSAEQYRDAGAHAHGSTAFANATLQRFSNREIVLYACEDISDIRVVGRDGSDLSRADRQTRFAVEITTSSTADETLLVSGDEVVNLDGVCA